MLVHGEEVARFVSERLNFGLCPPYVTLGTEIDGKIVNGVVFNCWEGPAIHATAAGKGWTRSFLKAVGDYVFDQLGCERVTLTTEQPAVVELALRLGGKVEGTLRNQFGKGRDGIVVGVLKDERRY